MKWVKSLIIICLISIVSGCSSNISPFTTNTPQITITQTIQPTLKLMPTITNTTTPSCFDQDPGDLSEPGNPSNSKRSNTLQPKITFNQSNFEVFQKVMHNRTIIVAIEKGFKLMDKSGNDKWDSNKQLSDFVINTWAIFWKEFGGFPFKSYTVVFGNNLPYEGGGYSLGLGLSNPSSAWIAHDIYHAWNGNAFRQQGERFWFLEGVTTYYGDIRQSNNRFQGKMSKFIDYYLGYYASGKDRAIGNMSGNDKDYDHQFVAVKGAVIAYLLDYELNKTGNNLGEVSRKLYEQFGVGSEGHPTNDQILTIVNQISREDFTEFFNKYIYGNEKLPVSPGQDTLWICHDNG
jgi:hypothetical protein